MTIRLVSHYAKDAISLDKPSPLANPKPRFAERDRDWNTSQYERWFWSRLSWNDSEQLKELDRLVEIWFSKGKLYLAVDTPHLKCHGDVICQYLKWQIERKGKSVDIIKPGDVPQAPPNRKVERRESIRHARTRVSF